MTKLDLFGKQPTKVICLGLTFNSHEERREYFLLKLKEILSDELFRKQPGFPVASIDDIIDLSDPPYYTACPNPWLGQLVEESTMQKTGNKVYSKGPFCSDVSEGKNHLIYLAHQYHTKVPHRAIMRYILHYTNPGDVILDGFCGTGMTGVAANLCGNAREIAELGYKVDSNGCVKDSSGEVVSSAGRRVAVLNDLSPAAAFIAYNYNRSNEWGDFLESSEGALEKVDSDYGWMYATLHAANSNEIEEASRAIASCKSKDELRMMIKGNGLREIFDKLGGGAVVVQTNYTVWSDVFSCKNCGGEVVYWEQAVDKKTWEMKPEFECPTCRVKIGKEGLEKAKKRSFDGILRKDISQGKSVQALIHYKYDKKNYTKQADKFDLTLEGKVASLNHDLVFPDQLLMGTGERWGDTWRAGVHLGVTNVHHFYSIRNLVCLAAYADAIGARRRWNNVTSVALVASKMYRFRSQGGSLGAGGGPLSGTMYIPSIIKEIPVLKMLREHIKKSDEVRSFLNEASGGFIQTGSASSLRQLRSDSVDYVFVDPPFGGNLMYSELNYIWESWLRVITNNREEAVTNDSQKKGLREYQELMTGCFREFFRVLRPGRWITVEFSNSKASVWNAIQVTLQQAGFVVANVSSLDKKQGSFKAVTSTTAVKQDLVISAYKPDEFYSPNLNHGSDAVISVWDFLSQHLLRLPVAISSKDNLDYIIERDPRILFDRMVAFFVSRSLPVPINSGEFQLELASRFPERDGMVFLKEQVLEYDKKRAKCNTVSQLAIFVEDERSAINWLRSFLKERPSCIQDIYPDFMQQLNASWKQWEKRPELALLLEQNFICYDGDAEVPPQIHAYLSTQFKDMRSLDKLDSSLREKASGRWYVPDPKRNVDLEVMRNRKLLAEFWSYLPKDYHPAALLDAKSDVLPGFNMQGAESLKRKRINEVRAEAVRAGFKFCYQKTDYKTIILAAGLIPDTLLLEDEYLQMVYDIAITRTGSHDE